MVFTRKDGDFHGQFVSFREGTSPQMILQVWLSDPMGWCYERKTPPVGEISLFMSENRMGKAGKNCAFFPGGKRK